MPDINARRLTHLVALAEEGSFARAAERVHLSQPALSRSIQTLEEEFGVKLFERASRGVTVTRHGRVLIERARRVLFEAQGLLRDVALLKDDALGSVCVGVGAYAAAVVLPEFNVGFSARYPGVKLSVKIGDAGDLLGRLRAKEADFVVIDRRELPVAPDCAIQRMTTHDGGWYARFGHPLSGAASVPIAALRRFPMVSVSLSAFMEDAVRRMLKIRPHEPVPMQFECNDVAQLASAVAQSDAVFFCIDSLRPRLSAGSLLAKIPVVYPRKLGLQFAAVYLADNAPAGAVREALDRVQEGMNRAGRGFPFLQKDA